MHGATLAEGMAGLGPEDLLIAVGFRRRVPAFATALGIARRCRTPTAVLTDPSGAALAGEARWVLTAHCRGAAIFDSYVAGVSLINHLASQLAQRLGARARTRLRAIEALHGEPATREVPVMVLTGESGQAHVLRAFELGVVDYVVKPAAAQVVSAKVTQVLEWAKRRQSGRGVSGSLQEMALPDVIQILAHGRKTGRLTVRNRDREGVVSFVEGEVYDAAYGTERGADAFYDILALVDGEFELDPTFRATTNVIQASTEALLLEAMRRFDERDRAHGSP